VESPGGIRAQGARWSNGAWRGALDVAQRPARLRSGDAAIGVFRRCEIAQSAVRPGVVIVILPGRQHGSNLRERGEQRLVEEFVAKPCVETLDEGVLGGLTGRDVVPFDPRLLAPAPWQHNLNQPASGKPGAVQS
jgi:hypothetical protein